MMFIGKQIDLIPHTGIVLKRGDGPTEAHEFFYSGGIQVLHPHRVVEVFGLAPVDRVLLGRTTKGDGELRSHLRSIAHKYTVREGCCSTRVLWASAELLRCQDASSSECSFGRLPLATGLMVACSVLCRSRSTTSSSTTATTSRTRCPASCWRARASQITSCGCVALRRFGCAFAGIRSGVGSSTRRMVVRCDEHAARKGLYEVIPLLRSRNPPHSCRSRPRCNQPLSALPLRRCSAT